MKSIQIKAENSATTRAGAFLAAAKSESMFRPTGRPAGPFSPRRPKILWAALLSATALSGGLVSVPAHAGCTNTSIDSDQTVNGTSATYCADLYVGDGGTGSLTVSNGGSVNDSGGRIANQSGSNGTVTVTGSGSTWTNTSSLSLGYFGTGNLTVSQGGNVSSDYGYLATQSGSHGTATITGAGSQWTIGNHLWVGMTGVGQLTISDGGRVTNDRSFLGQASGVTSTAVVTGAGSTWTNSGYLTVGVYNASSGVLTVSDGGTVTSVGGRLGYMSGSQGTVTVTGSGSTWTDTGSVHIGDAAGGTAQVTVSNGGKLDSTSSLVVGYGGTGTLVVSGGGTVVSNGASIGDSAGSTGTAEVAGAGSTWTADGLTVGFFGAGTITLSDGGTLTVGSGAGTLIAALGSGSTGTLNIGSAAGQAATAAGTLDAAAVSFGSGTGTLVFNHTNSAYAFAPLISGAGSVKVYAGTTTLSVANTYTGGTTIYGGRLAVDGSIGAVSVHGGTLGGIGTVGALAVLSGGTVGPGNSIGTLNVNGNVSFAAGGIYEVEVDNAGNTDLLNVTGGVSLGGATLRIVGLPGTYDADQYAYLIIANDGTDAVVGTFGTVDNRLAFYTATVSYNGGTGNDVVVTLDRNANNFADVAATPNQRAVAGRLTALPGSDGDTLRNDILALTTAETQHAYDQLSGDIYAAVPQVNVQVTRQLRHRVAGRLATLRASAARTTARRGVSLSAAQIAGFAATTSDSPAALGYSELPAARGNKARNGLWMQAVGGFGRIAGDANTATVDYDWRGAMSGYDAALSPNLRMGAFFGYVKGSSSQDAIGSDVDSDTFMTGLYGSYEMGDWHLDAQAAWSRIASDSHRALTFGGVDRIAQADYTDHVVSLQAELARSVEVKPDLWLEPYADAVVEEQFLGGFTESGAGTADLTRPSDRELDGSGTIGLRVSGQWDSGDGWQLVPQADLGWRHRFGPNDNTALVRFSGGDPFTVSGTPTDRDSLVGELGISRVSADGWQAYAAYEPTVSAHQWEHSFVAGLRFTW